MARTFMFAKWIADLHLQHEQHETATHVHESVQDKKTWAARSLLQQSPID